jgi:hypothetical protein
MKQEKKYEWITKEQWVAVPYESWWEDQRKGAEYIAQLSPRTT